MRRTTSPRGGGFAHKVKPNKPKNLAQAGDNHRKAIEAINQQVCLSCTYDGLFRVVEVHTVGTTTARRPAMSVWQVDGQSNSTPVTGWRLFCFDECFNVALTDIPSKPSRPEYKKRAEQFRVVDREV
jgi:hypothetical protein